MALNKKVEVWGNDLKRSDWRIPNPADSLGKRVPVELKIKLGLY